MLSQAEYVKKQGELSSLARSVDLWKHAPQTPKQKEQVAELLETLQAETFALECAFLERKMAIFTQILAVFKKEK